MLPDEEGNLIMMGCGGKPGCSGHLQVPQLRVVGSNVAGGGAVGHVHLDVSYSADDAEFVLETSGSAGLRVGGVDVAAQDARLAALEKRTAALRNTQTRIRCALIASGALAAEVGDTDCDAV